MSWNVVEQDETNKIPVPQVVVRHEHTPIRGAFYGAVLGFGLTLLLATYALVPLGEHAPWVAAGFGAVGGLILSWFGPAIRRRN